MVAHHCVLVKSTLKFVVMTRTEIPRGRGSTHAAEAVVAVRRSRGLSKAELGRRLAELGRPMSKDVLLKIEQGKRRLDPDDLIALALALGVTPNRLLLPSTLVEEDVALTPAVTVPLSQAWAWATGDQPLDVEEPDVVAEHPTAFRRANRPHDMIGAYSAIAEEKRAGHPHPHMDSE